MVRKLTVPALAVFVSSLAAAQPLVFREFPIPTPGSAPIDVAGPPQGSTIFIELEGNKVGILRPTGVGDEVSIPTPNSGPMSLIYVAANSVSCGSGFELWFTESRANRIGRVCYVPQFEAHPTLSALTFLPEFPIPTPNSEPRGIVSSVDRTSPQFGIAWFTEFAGNKIGRVDANGVMTEFPIPTPGSGPWGIAFDQTTGHVWFTEFRANRIGRLDPATGVITEFPIPTPNSGPAEIVLSGNELWFTESNAGKIGRITQEGAITELALPDPASQPFGMAADPNGGVWFTERAAGRVGRAKPDGSIREFPLPTAGSGPTGISVELRGFGGAPRFVVAESAADRLAVAEADFLVMVGAGNTGPSGPIVENPGTWDTEIQMANPDGFGTSLNLGRAGPFPGPCRTASCGHRIVGLPPNGTATLFASSVPPSGVQTWYASPAGFEIPTVKARIINREVPTLSADLPVVRYSTIEALDPQVLSFPGAVKNAAGARSNLVLTSLERRPFVSVGPMTVVVEIFSPAGDLLGNGSFTLEAGTLFLADVVGRLGVSELDEGQVRVRKIGGGGLLWGILATIREDATLTISLGVNP